MSRVKRRESIAFLKCEIWFISSISAVEYVGGGRNDKIMCAWFVGLAQHNLCQWIKFSFKLFNLWIKSK